MTSIGQMLMANLLIYRLVIAGIGIVVGIALGIQSLTLLFVFVGCAYLLSWILEKRGVSFSSYINTAIPPLLAITSIFMPHLPKFVKLIVCALVAFALIGSFFFRGKQRNGAPAIPKIS